MSYVCLKHGVLERSTLESAGWDLRNAGKYQQFLYPGNIYKIPTGVITTFSSDLVAVIKEKSGLALKGFNVHAGVIDCDYKDEWQVVVTVSKLVIIESGQKIAQVLFIPVPVIERLYSQGQWITKSDERTGGWGSTGL